MLVDTGHGKAFKAHYSMILLACILVGDSLREEVYPRVQ